MKNDKFEPIAFNSGDFLKDPEVANEYEKQKSKFLFYDSLIQARKKADLSQEEIALRMGTKKSNISRLERATYENPPSLRSLMKYAHALGFHLEIKLVPDLVSHDD